MNPPRSFRLVAQLSTYREGPLVRAAVRSCFDAGLDAVVVWEGPAGPSLLDHAPRTDYAFEEIDRDTFAPYAKKMLAEREGEWATDGDKRTAMLKWTKERFHDRPLWVVLVDGDEVLVNGRYLRDLIQHAIWMDEQRGASIADPDNLPTGGLPLRIMEADGSVSFTRSRVFNANVIRRFVVSNLIVETAVGTEMRLGHQVEDAPPAIRALRHVLERRPLELPAAEADVLRSHLTRNFALPPLPCEPFLYHRSHLRHPARSGLRLHEQERDEIVRLGYPTGQENPTDER